MFDTEKFIVLVQDYPSIWDKGAKVYCDRVVREKGWRDIGEQMMENWTDLTDEEQQKESELNFIYNFIIYVLLLYYIKIKFLYKLKG